MLNENVIDKFLNLMQYLAFCGPEYTNKEKIIFVDGSFESIHLEILNSFNKNDGSLNNIDDTFKKINDLKDNKSPNFFISLMPIHFKLSKISPKNLINSLSLTIDPWIQFCESRNIEITEDVNHYQDIITIISKFEFPEKCLNELHYINQLMSAINKNDVPETEPFLLSKMTEYFNNPLTVLNTTSLNNIVYDQLVKNNIFELLEGIKKIHKSIVNKIEDKIPTINLYPNSKIINDYNNANISGINDFMLLKTLDKRDKIYPLNNFGTYTSIIEIADQNSLIVQKKDGKLEDVKTIQQKLDIIHITFEEEILNILSKKPFIAKAFVGRLKENYKDIKLGIVAAETYIKNENTLRSNNYSIIDSLKLLSFEELDDSMNKCILNHKIKQYAHSITSSKYMHLYNEDSYKIFKEIYELGIDSTQLQNAVGKKIAANKTPEEFNSYLNKYLQTLNTFNMESFKLRATNINCEIINDTNNILILHIKDYNESKNMGSSSWCISRNEEYFKSYTDDGAMQYFIYDFNKDSKDNDSMIGLTLTHEGEHSASHLKDDDQIDMDHFLEDIQLKIIIKHKENFNITDHHLKYKIEAEENKINAQKSLINNSLFLK